MSLPIGCGSPSEYFSNVLDFLQQYSWIYRTSNTCFIKENIFEIFPEEWTLYFTNISCRNLSLFPENFNEDNPPKSIKEFQNKLSLLKPNLATNCSENLNFNINLRKVGLKKNHEITILGNLILEVCKNDIDILVDFGSGLGYLSEFLYQINNNTRILGLESDDDRVTSATNRLEKYYPAAKGNVYFLKHFITESSNKFINANIIKLYPQIKNPKIAFIGLHSCADLTNVSINIFLENFQTKKLIIMPCCYHKLEVLESNDDGIYFKNFPLSKTLKEIAKNLEYGKILNRPFLRLGCQQTSSRWREMDDGDHFNHGQEMFLRGVLETIRNENETICKKFQNKKMLSLDLNINDIKSIYEIKLKENNVILEWTKEKEIQIKKVLSKYPNGWKLTEALTCLQTSMQQLCENLILFDRLCFINEQQNMFNNLIIKSRFEKILDDKLSPRCFTLIAEKINSL